MKKAAITFILFLFTLTTFSQLGEINPDYLKTLDSRADKIVLTLGLTDTNQIQRVKEIIILQYYNLSKIHDIRDSSLINIKQLTAEEKEKSKILVQNEINSSLYKLHNEYISKLASELTFEQIEKIKDGMTYGVFKRTYDGYLNLLPSLTEEQKKYIYSNLYEAREFAMDAGSSEEKHGWFGKYKGRINNYLSKEGYDLKKAESERNNK